MRRGKLIGFGSHRGGAFILQSLPPELDALHWTQVRAGPIEPLVVAVAPLPVVNQDFLVVVIDLFNAGGVPAGEREYHEMGLESQTEGTSRCQVPDRNQARIRSKFGQSQGERGLIHSCTWLLCNYLGRKIGIYHSCNVSRSVCSCVVEPPPAK